MATSFNVGMCQISTPTFHHLGQKDLLDDGWIHSFISQDSYGFIWINSQQGFYRFDGNRFKKYNNLSSNSEGEYVQSKMWEDHNADLWYTTISSIHKLDRQTDSVESIQFKYNNNKLDKSNHIFFLEKRNHTIWFAANGYFWQYDIDNKENLTPYFETKGVRFAVDTLKDGSVVRIFALPWFNSPGIEVWEKNNNEWCYYQPSGKLFETTIFSNVVPMNGGKVFLTSIDKGIVEFDCLGNKINYIYYPENIPGVQFWTGVKKDANSLIISTFNDGILFFDTNKKSFIYNWKNRINDPTTLHSNQARDLFLDHNQRLWVTHLDGTVDFSRNIKSDDFSNSFKEITKRKGQSIINLIEDKFNRVWILSQEGMHVHDCFGRQELFLNKQDLGIANYQKIRHLNLDKSGRIWLTTSYGVLFAEIEENIKSMKWRKIQDETQSYISTYAGFDSSILLISTQGIFRLPYSEEEKHLEKAPFFKEYVNFEFDYGYHSNDSHLFPFDKNSLWEFKEVEGKIKLKTVHSLSADTYDVGMIKGSDTTWVATSRGLAILVKGQLVNTLSTNELGTNSAIYSINTTTNGDLWLTSSNALWKYNYKTKHLNKYTTKDGLLSDKFIINASLQASDGKIWLGTDKGVVFFHPDSVKTDFPVPKAYIEALWVNNIPYDTEFVINEMDTLELGYRENTLAFDLRAIGFYQAELSTLRYHLKGYDDDEVSVENGGFARFTKIPPGNYTLEVTPVNANGQAGKVKRLKIIITPPFWQTLWFKIMVILSGLLLITAIIGAFYRRKLKQQQRLIENQKALAAERNRIAKELHDDMGSSLSSILFLSEDLLVDEDDTDNNAISPDLQRIAELAEDSLENMRDIIWAMDSKKNTLEDLSSQIRAFAASYLADHKIANQLNISDHGENVPLGGEVRRNIYLIAKEAIHNAVKHAQAAIITISLFVEKNQLILKIEDDGLGMNITAGESNKGYGLVNMKKRAKDIGGDLKINSKEGEGTEILLSLPL